MYLSVLVPAVISSRLSRRDRRNEYPVALR